MDLHRGAPTPRLATFGDLLPGCYPFTDSKSTTGRAGTPESLGVSGPYEREKGLESRLSLGYSEPFRPRDSDPRCVSQPPDASGRVVTSTDAGSVLLSSPSLPPVSQELFFAAGAALAARAAQRAQTHSRVDEILRRAVDQAAALGKDGP